TRGSSRSRTQSSVICAMSAETITTSTRPLPARRSSAGSRPACEALSELAARARERRPPGGTFPASMGPSFAKQAGAEVPAETVAMPTYNGRELLEVVLPSLARQRFRDFEVVVVDDGSRDDTVQWLRERWPEVQLIALPENGGVTAAMNVC